jgi:peptidoglycan-associated lipoprotein
MVPLLLVTACAANVPARTASTTQAVTPPVAPPLAAAPRAEPTTGMIAISDEIRTACGITSDDAFFAFDSANIDAVDIHPLDAVARCFTNGPLAGRSMRLIGHADPRGPSEYNVTLGQRRADSVEGYIDQRGVKRSQIGTTSRGAMDATGQDETGWAHDRRVDVQLGT